jgi:hypothetical protein
MARKEIFIQPLDYIINPSALTEGAMRAYRFLTEVAKDDPAYSDTRAGMDDDFRDLWEYMRWCEVVAESIKEGFKQCMKVDPEHLPACASWEKQTYQLKFTDGVAAARALAAEYGKDVAEFAVGLTPTQAMKVAGIDEDALAGIVGENFVKTPKERVLNMK